MIRPVISSIARWYRPLLHGTESFHIPNNDKTAKQTMAERNDPSRVAFVSSAEN
jgi:hypothetical protein